MNQKAGAATVSADHAGAAPVETDKALYDLGVISGPRLQGPKGKADEFTTRNDLETQRLTANQKAIESQMAQQQAKVDQMRCWRSLNKTVGRPESSRRDHQRLVDLLYKSANTCCQAPCWPKWCSRIT
jgi:hypothetical protein